MIIKLNLELWQQVIKKLECWEIHFLETEDIYIWESDNICFHIDLFGFQTYVVFQTP